MAYLDDNGILVIEDTDEIAPLQTLLNGMQTATSDVVTGLKVDIAAAADAAENYVRRREAHYRTTAATVNNETWTTIGGLNGEVHTVGQPSNSFTAGGNYIQANYSGWIRIRAFATYETNIEGTRLIRINRNNGSIVASNGLAVRTGSNTLLPSEVIYEGPTSSGWRYEIQVHQSSGETLSLYTNSYSTGYVVERIS